MPHFAGREKGISIFTDCPAFAPNTLPLDPEEPSDLGAVADMPPGEYALSLYRVDWEACERKSIGTIGTYRKCHCNQQIQVG